MSADEVDAVVQIVSADPTSGDVMQGTGGCGKVRVAGRSKGKSGGYRVITFFTGPNLPVLLITVFGKGERANLTKAERNGLAALTKTLADSYRNKVVSLGTRR